MAASDLSPVIASGCWQGWSLNRMLAEHSDVVRAMSLNPAIRHNPKFCQWFNDYEAYSQGCSASTPPPAPTYILTKGIHKGQSLDIVAQEFPSYVKRLVARREIDSHPGMRVWFDTHQDVVETICRAKTFEGPVFTTGKCAGMTYSEVLKKRPRYMIKLLNRGSPKILNQKEWLQNNDARIQELRLRHGSTKGELRCVEVFKKLGVTFRCEFTIPNLPNKRFDFVIQYQGINFLVEADGIQHFTRTKRYHKTEKKFREYQDNDVIKTRAGLEAGYRMIRIDHKELKLVERVEYHLRTALVSDVNLYVSNPELYAWLLARL
jgi:hypothetical protein